MSKLRNRNLKKIKMNDKIEILIKYNYCYINFKMGCCTSRIKVDEHSLLTDYQQVNTLPTYENIYTAYVDLQLPLVDMCQLPHKKE